MNSPSSASRSVAISIVTGASRGLGRALAEQLLARGHRVLTLQRKPQLVEAPLQDRLQAWACDLAQPLAAAQRLEAWLNQLQAAEVRTITLINNAALLPPPADLSQSDSAALAEALRVSLEAPLLLSAAFLRATEAWPIPKRLMHISSGLGRRAMAGSAVYCAAKAGLDHLSRVIALEEADKPHGAKSVSIAPGVIDTDMQVQLRSADPRVFSAQPMFEGLKTQGQLDSPDACARKLLAYLDRADFGSQAVADIRDAG
jgi:benzil reductase ((S)-benzoin forming)